MVYAASSAALAVLEVRVHLDLPPALLPDDTRLREQRTPILRVPSAIVPESSNLLLNPVHPSSARARVSAIRAFTFDPRLWLTSS